MEPLYLSKNFKDVFICMSALLHVHARTTYVPDQKVASDPLELESGIVVSHHVGTGNPSWVLRKSNK